MKMGRIESLRPETLFFPSSSSIHFRVGFKASFAYRRLITLFFLSLLKLKSVNRLWRSRTIEKMIWSGNWKMNFVEIGTRNRKISSEFTLELNWWEFWGDLLLEAASMAPAASHFRPTFFHVWKKELCWRWRNEFGNCDRISIWSNFEWNWTDESYAVWRPRRWLWKRANRAASNFSFSRRNFRHFQNSKKWTLMKSWRRTESARKKSTTGKNGIEKPTLKQFHPKWHNICMYIYKYI